MFKCQICSKQSQSGEKENKVFSYRPKTYKNEIKVKGQKKKTKIKISQGTEITKEVIVCNTCMENR